MNELTPIQVRILGCLMEKKETTPEQYPLTLNALRNACNQKTSRSPVVSYSEGEVGHTLRELEALDLVREEWGARAPKYEHRVNKALSLHSQDIALLCALMLRGPQTPGELKTNTHRLFDFADLDDLEFALQQLIKREPSLVVALPRQPGQKEGRFAHLLSGEPDMSVFAAAAIATAATAPPGLEARVKALEAQLEDLQNRLNLIEEVMDPK